MAHSLGWVTDACANGAMLRLETDIFKRPHRHLAQYASPPLPPPNFMACIAFQDSTSVLRNFRANDLQGIIAQMGSVLLPDADNLYRWFAEHDTWFCIREVPDEEFESLLRIGHSG